MESHFSLPGDGAMARAATNSLMHVVRRVVDDRRARELPDHELLQAFIDRQDETAFLALLRRHGQTVLGVCRALLPNEADAEDAFQATFLVFADKARSIRQKTSLGSWLHGVAYRTACRARTAFARGKKHERLAARPETSSADETTWREVQAVLHEELGRLAERYREPLVLCYLQGKTLDEAAARLGVGKSTLKTRLERGRTVLRARLVRRGLGSAGVLLAAAWPGAAEAGLPAALVGSTASAVWTVATDPAVAAAIPPSVAALRRGVVNAMRISRFTRITAVVAVLALAGSGPGWLAYSMLLDPPAQQQAPASPVAGERVAADKTRSSRPALILQAPPVIAVDSVAVSPDGSLVATAGDGVRLYDARTGNLVRAIGDAGGRCVAFSPDGRRVAAAGFHLESTSGTPLMTLPIYDVQTGRRVQTLTGHTEWETYAIAFSPDGKLFASSGADKQLLIWELATGKVRHQLAAGTTRVIALAFSPDGTLLASGGSDKAVRLWDMTTGRAQAWHQDQADWVCTLAFAPDGKWIASGSCDWGRHQGRETTRMPPSKPDYRSGLSLRFIANDSSVAKSLPGQLRSVAFHPDGKLLAYAVDKEIWLYDIPHPNLSKVVAHHDLDVTSVAFTSDGNAVISGGHDQTVKCTDLATGRTIWQTSGSFEQVNAIAISKDGKLLATGSSDGRYAQRLIKADAAFRCPGAVRLWDFRTGRLLRRLGDRTEQVMAVALSPDGQRLAAGGVSAAGSGVVRVWQAETGKPVWFAEDPKNEVLAITYAPDGSLLATAAADGQVRLRDPATGATRLILEGHAGGATSLVFSADGARLLCGDGLGATHVWDARTGRLLRTCKAEQSKVAPVTRDRMFTSIALSPDGETLVECAATGGNTYNEPVRLWDLRSGQLKREFTTEVHSARPIALSPDGSILALGGKTIKLWDVRTGKQLRELFGYLKKTQAITFSADGKFLISGGSYGTTNAWEVATGRHIVTLFTFPGTQKGTDADDWLTYSPNGYYDGSPGVERYLGWRVGDELKTPDTLGKELHRPGWLGAALHLPAPRPGSPRE
jgi:RNA polymerase sigma factor (sigma-70 family)